MTDKFPLLLVSLSFAAGLLAPASRAADAATKPKAAAAPALPPGIGVAAVVRHKRCADLLTAAGMSENTFFAWGMGRLLDGLIQDRGNRVVTSVSAWSQEFRKGTHWELTSTAAPCTMEDFLIMSGVGPTEATGDGKFRKLEGTYKDRKILLTFQQLSPREYLFTQVDSTDPGPANAAKLLSELRATVAAGDYLMWFGATRHTLAPDAVPHSGPPSEPVRNLSAALSWTDEVEFHLEATLPSAAEATAAAGWLKSIIPPVPELPAGAAAPVVNIQSTGTRATFDLTIPKGTAPPLATALRDKERRQMREKALAIPEPQGPPPPNPSTVIAKAKQDAKKISTGFNAAKAAGSQATQIVHSADLAILLMQTGTTGAGKFSTTAFKVSLAPTDQEMAALFLVWRDGALVFTGDDFP